MDKAKVQDATPQQLETWLAQLSHRCEGLAMGRAENRALYENLDDNKSRLKATYMEQTAGDSQAAKEAAVLASAPWGEFLAELAQARHDYFVVSAEYDTAIRKWETIRSIMSSRNSERRMV